MTRLVRAAHTRPDSSRQPCGQASVRPRLAPFSAILAMRSLREAAEDAQPLPGTSAGTRGHGASLGRAMKISAEDSAPEPQFSAPASFTQAYGSVMAARAKRPGSAIGSSAHHRPFAVDWAR
jgi:hypothetical protein